MTIKVDDPLFSVKELAEYLHLNNGTIRNMISNATIPFDFFKVGKRVLFRKSDVDKWLNEDARVKCVKTITIQQ